VPGGHSIQQLNTALGTTIETRQEGESLVVQIRVSNRGAGHSVPTGMPGRRVILDLTVRSSRGSAFEAEKTFGRSYADARGQIITEDRQYFAKGVSLVSDTRIRTDERRLETFRFPIPPEVSANLTLRLRYEHTPTGDDSDKTSLTFLSESRTIEPRSGSK
jgi:hypothetical protein